MKPKKSEKADLRKKRFLFIEIGLLLSLSLCLVAFEWTSESKRNVFGSSLKTGKLEPEMVITLQEEIPEPPAPEPIKPIIDLTKFNVVDNDTETPIPDFTAEDNNDPVSPIITHEIPVIIDDTPLDPIPWVEIGIKPEFPGGEKALLKFISENTTYPALAKEAGIKGKVFVEFVIGIDGKVSNVRVVRSVDKYLDEEAVRVVSAIPDWKPGKQLNKAVPVSYIIPISFKLY